MIKLNPLPHKNLITTMSSEAEHRAVEILGELHFYVNIGNHYICLICDRKYLGWKNYRRHAVNLHNLKLSVRTRREEIEKKFVCMCCGKAYVWSTNLMRHRRDMNH